MEIVRINAPVPGQCRVMFCVATDHDGGTQHYDITGQAYVSCVHGTLSHWPPCGQCGYGTDNQGNETGRILDTLTEQYRAVIGLRKDRVEQLGENNIHVTFTDVQIQAFLYCIGAAASVRLGRDLTRDLIAAKALETIAVGRTYVESIPAE